MRPITPLDYVLIVGGALLLIAELIAVASHDVERRPTISSRVIGWMKLHPWHRWFVFGMLVWLAYHFTFQNF